MSGKKRPLVKDRKTALYGGYAFIVIGSYLLYEAYEKRGHKRPFAAKFLPGP